MLTKGFTIVELMVVIVVVGILTGILFGPMDDLYWSNMRNLKQVSETANAHSALEAIQNNIALSTGFLSTNNVTDIATTPEGSGGWSYSNNGVNNVLITSNYATSSDESQDPTGTRTLILSADCSTPLQNNYVYFVSNSTLYRRTIKNSASTCTGYSNAQKQTCAAGFSNGNCQATDAVLANDVTNFTVKYYASPEAATTTSSPASASTVVLTLSVQTRSAGAIESATNSIRVTHIN